MMEVCRYSDASYSDASSVSPSPVIMMKHSAVNVETFEFNLGKAPQLRCVNSDKATSCNQCEACQLGVKLKDIKQWFPRLGDHSRKRFMLGLMQRLHSAELLHQIVKLLQPMLCKDFTYSRSRTNPSMDTDMTTLSADRALPQKLVEDYMGSTWHWFSSCNYWSKANFCMVLLQMCDSHLLHAVGIQARTLLISETRAASAFQDDDYMENESIASSTYSYHTDKHPDLDLLTTAGRQYGTDNVNPFTGEPFHTGDLGEEIENAASDDELAIQSSLSSVDPACMVIPTSAKAYAGVVKNCDFIRMLPIHLSKMVLSMLDKTSLMNALCVSSYWRGLVEEVHRDFYVNQQLWEEVMLMQGAAAQGSNPVYASDIDVLVPNVNHQSGQILRNEEAVIKTTFKSEVSFETAYSGISTRKVIMEERNVYCGAYNVMVICDQEDVHRVCHTDGGKLIVIGSKDRKVRFIDSITCREHKRMTKGESKSDELPIITGHAGSIRCVHILEKRGLVLSGSYDTSIRMWNINTGHCMRIFRGHRDTVLSIQVLGDLMATSSKDKSCKVWNLQTGKCQRTFRHRYPVLAVAMSDSMVITGCEGGRVKVWNLMTGNLIKILNGHHEAVTAIRFDRWHIVTGGRDGYALVWSTIGDHNRCLTALRHPKEVLCLEFMYLRCITGSGDGRVRIWNVITGQCCRIMRGNSRSDPILDILALDDRITINTSVNLLVLNFEQVEWNYNLVDDKVPPLVQYGHYSDAPVRNQPYPYIRAQRMRKAGATNTKILNHGQEAAEQSGGKVPLSQIQFRTQQLPHSAKTLSARSLGSARQIQRQSELGYDTSSMSLKELRSVKSAEEARIPSKLKQSFSAQSSKPPLPQSPKTRPQTSKSGASVTIMGEAMEQDSEDEWREPLSIKRRVSWAFEHPFVPEAKEITLSETKSLLRSQMRMKAETVVPPDFIYLTVNAIQASMKPTEASTNTELNMRDGNRILIDTKHKKERPTSSPGKIDPRTRMPLEEVHLQFDSPKKEDDNFSEFSDVQSVKSFKSVKSTKDSRPTTADRETYATKCHVKPLKTSPKVSIHPKHIRTTLPKGRVIRPISASVTKKEPPPTQSVKYGRPVTAPQLRYRPDTASSIPSNIAASLPGMAPRRRPQTGTSSETSFVPMLMYPPNMKEKLAEKLKERRQQKAEDMLESASEMGLGQVSPFSDPLRTHVKFELRTHNQEEEFIAGIEKMHVKQKAKDDALMEKKRKQLWTAKAKGMSRVQSAPVL